MNSWDKSSVWPFFPKLVESSNWTELTVASFAANSSGRSSKTTNIGAD